MFECVCACDCFSVVLIKKCMKKIYIIYLNLAFEPPAPTGFQSNHLFWICLSFWLCITWSHFTKLKQENRIDGLMLRFIRSTGHYVWDVSFFRTAVSFFSESPQGKDLSSQHTNLPNCISPSAVVFFQSVPL